jgi:hypothetical protein
VSKATIKQAFEAVNMSYKGLIDIPAHWNVAEEEGPFMLQVCGSWPCLWPSLLTERVRLHMREQRRSKRETSSR